MVVHCLVAVELKSASFDVALDLESARNRLVVVGSNPARLYVRFDPHRPHSFRVMTASISAFVFSPAISR